MQSSVQLQLRGFGNVRFRNISGSCINVTRNMWVPLGEVVYPLSSRSQTHIAGCMRVSIA